MTGASSSRCGESFPTPSRHPPRTARRARPSPGPALLSPPRSTPAAGRAPDSAGLMGELPTEPEPAQLHKRTQSDPELTPSKPKPPRGRHPVRAIRPGLPERTRDCTRTGDRRRAPATVRTMPPAGALRLRDDGGRHCGCGPVDGEGGELSSRLPSTQASHSRPGFWGPGRSSSRALHLGPRSLPRYHSVWVDGRRDDSGVGSALRWSGARLSRRGAWEVTAAAARRRVLSTENGAGRPRLSRHQKLQMETLGAIGFRQNAAETNPRDSVKRSGIIRFI